jgi:hypothetical protein
VNGREIVDADEEDDGDGNEPEPIKAFLHGKIIHVKDP